MQEVNHLPVENPLPPYKVPSGDIQLICSPSKPLVLGMESVEESHGSPGVNRSSLAAIIPGKAAQLPEVALHTPVWLSVMMHEVVVLDSFHTVLPNGLPASSHVHTTTLLEVQKLSHMKMAWPVLGGGRHTSFTPCCCHYITTWL